MSARDYVGLVKFSHSIFALPFALQGAWLAGGGTPKLSVLCLIVACAVAARTAAMAFNRLVDREIDARNPRTRDRELPAGRLSARGVAALILTSSALFVAAAFALNTLAGLLAVPVKPRNTATFLVETAESVAVTVATPPASAIGLPERPSVTVGPLATSSSVMVAVTC